MNELAGHTPGAGGQPHRVWFDFGWGPPAEHEEETLAELNAFLAGVQFACEQTGMFDYTRLDTPEELARHREETGR